MTQLMILLSGQHSALDAELNDGIILGASSNDQLIQTVESLQKGPLSDETAAQLEKVWKTCEAGAPRYCS
jgi:aflatoxin B1 aldehyde reductase